MFSRAGLQIQENLTTQIAESLMRCLEPSRRGGGRGGETSLHDDARRGKAKLGDEDFLFARHFQRRRTNALGISRAPQGLIVGRLCQTPARLESAVSQRRPTIICVMLLTVSKRLEFSASRRLHVSSWSDAKNLAVFGPETYARYGTGRNYVAYFVFTGPVDRTQRNAD